MRSPALVTSLAALLVVFVAGCAADTTPPVAGKKTTKPPTTTPDPVMNPNDDLKPAQPKDPAPTPSANEVGTETWATGKAIPAAGVTIKAGATVTIDSGAAVTVGAGGAITIKGSLVVKTGATHASISGMNWKGIVVASGGTLNVDGLDIKDAEIAVFTQKGNLDATLLNSSVLNAGNPFTMEAGSKLTVTKSKVVGTKQSNIAGTFVASRMDYDKTSAEGLELNDAAGSMTISDCG